MRFMPTADGRLAGVRVLVTRPASQATDLTALIRAAGGEAIVFPTLAIEPLAPEAAQVGKLAACDTVIFVSANAARHGFPVLRDLDGTDRRVIAVGNATRRALEALGCRDVDTPAGDQGSSEGLLASPALANVTGRAICIVRGAGGREVLREALTARGAAVSYLECYRRVLPPEPDTAALLRALDDGHRALVISVTSVTGLTNLLRLTPDEHLPRLLARPLVVIGSRQRTAALENGWLGPVLEAGAGDAKILETIADWRHQT